MHKCIQRIWARNFVLHAFVIVLHMSAMEIGLKCCEDISDEVEVALDNYS
ncbi:MAG: hypothetical protein HQK51_09440 [Oligoflexia bacterium]|nr:hypothetical protein [Oligoflexia bacterium]